MKKLILLPLILAIVAMTICSFVSCNTLREICDGGSVNDAIHGDNDGGASGGTGGGGSISDFIQSVVSPHPNKDPETARNHLEAAGYDANLLTYSDRADGLAARLEAALDSETPDDFECINIYYFESEEMAEAAWPELEKEGEEMKAFASFLGYGSSVVCNKDGAVIYYGTKNAVDAAK